MVRIGVEVVVLRKVGEQPDFGLLLCLRFSRLSGESVKLPNEAKQHPRPRSGDLGLNMFHIMCDCPIRTKTWSKCPILADV